ncbi:MAG: AraC family transcriptional regulator [Phycisphaerae bacterium]|nr:AraC family transcriptional regulator [Phycisphaerae bacterium]
MHRYVRNKTDIPACGLLSIRHNKDAYCPVVLHITVGQDRPLGDVHTFREHRHALYHIVLYTAGRGACLLDGSVHTAEPGTVVIVSPGQSHDFITRFGTSVYSELTVSFENPRRQPLTLPIENLLAQLAGSPIQMSNPKRLSDAEAHLFNAMLTEISDIAGLEHTLSEFYLRYALLRLFHYIVQTCVQPTASGAIADERLIRVRRYIEQNYNSPITIEELAQLAGMSKGYFFRAFGKAFDVSPLAYQKQLRLEAARTLLRSSALRCSEIAVRCGYENIHFFYRIFKQTFGVTPTHYRKDITT